MTNKKVNALDTEWVWIKWAEGEGQKYNPLQPHAPAVPLVLVLLPAPPARHRREETDPGRFIKPIHLLTHRFTIKPTYNTGLPSCCGCARPGSPNRTSCPTHVNVTPIGVPRHPRALTAPAPRCSPAQGCRPQSRRCCGMSISRPIPSPSPAQTTALSRAHCAPTPFTSPTAVTAELWK